MSNVATAKVGLQEAAQDYTHATQHGDQIGAGSSLCLAALRYSLTIVLAAGHVGLEDPVDLLKTLAGPLEIL